jgi:hypothetical protein
LILRYLTYLFIARPLNYGGNDHDFIGLARLCVIIDVLVDALICLILELDFKVCQWLATGTM